MVFEREQAAFEAGIKLGALYHQFIGTPVSPETAPKLEEAIEQSIGLQPFVEQVRVRLDRAAMQENIFGYSELAGTMLSVDLVTRVGRASCHARLRKERDYPLMEIVKCHEEPESADN
jgi:hypothetical protein